MRMTKTLAFENLARKSREGEGDIEDKFHVIKILRDFFGLHGLTGEVVEISEDSCRLPDILIKTNPRTIIEMDGQIHGSDEITKPERDINRDSDYKKLGFNLIIINKENTLGYSTDKVIKSLQEQGLKLI